MACVSVDVSMDGDRAVLALLNGSLITVRLPLFHVEHAVPWHVLAGTQEHRAAHACAAVGSAALADRVAAVRWFGAARVLVSFANGAVALVDIGDDALGAVDGVSGGGGGGGGNKLTRRVPLFGRSPTLTLAIAQKRPAIAASGGGGGRGVGDHAADVADANDDEGESDGEDGTASSGADESDEGDEEEEEEEEDEEEDEDEDEEDVVVWLLQEEQTAVAGGAGEEQRNGASTAPADAQASGSSGSLVDAVSQLLASLLGAVEQPTYTTTSHYRLTRLQQLEPKRLLLQLVAAEDFGAARELAMQHDLNADAVYCAMWRRGGATKHNVRDSLCRVSDREWVLREVAMHAVEDVDAALEMCELGLRLTRLHTVFPHAAAATDVNLSVCDGKKGGGCLSPLKQTWTDRDRDTRTEMH